MTSGIPEATESTEATVAAEATPKTKRKMPKQNPASFDWLHKFNQLTAGNEWLLRKIDRDRRLPEIFEYAQKYAPTLQSVPAGTVIDIGPGPGEFLEIARMYGHTPLGIDAETGTNGMGNPYLTASKMLAERQKIPVVYCGLTKWLKKINPLLMGDVAFINSRGSIEQSFARYMTGPPHHEHHRCSELSWNVDGRTRDAFEWFFSIARRLLRSDGELLIHANGAKNTGEYEKMICKAAEVSGLVLDYSESPRLHRWKIKANAENGKQEHHSRS